MVVPTKRIHNKNREEHKLHDQNPDLLRERLNQVNEIKWGSLTRDEALKRYIKGLTNSDEQSGPARGLHFTESEVLEAVMNRTVSFKSAMPALVLGAALMLLAPTAAMAQRGGGARGGHSSGSFSGRSFSGGGRQYSAPSYAGRSYSGGGRSYAAPYAGRSYSGGRSYYGGGHYGGGGAYYSGRFYAGRGYYYGGRFWARPY